MRYAKLINSYPSYAPNPIVVDGNYIGNPPGEIYEAEGYKPVHYTDPPTEPDEGYQWRESWSETEDVILQGWELVPVPDDVSADEAMEILFGGEGE